MRHLRACYVHLLLCYGCIECASTTQVSGFLHRFLIFTVTQKDAASMSHQNQATNAKLNGMEELARQGSTCLDTQPQPHTSTERLTDIHDQQQILQAEANKEKMQRELESTASLVVTKLMEEDARTERVTEDLHHNVMDQLHSQADLKAVKQLEEEERAVRITENKLHDVMDQLQSKADLITVKQLGSSLEVQR